MDWTECDLYKAKKYMRAEEEDDDVISDFLDMAYEYLAEAGIYKTEQNKGRYKIVFEAIALHYYDNRNAKADVDFSRSLQRAINQLKPAY